MKSIKGLYTDKGIKRRFAFPCPKCRSHDTRVVCTTQDDVGGEIYRRRCCQDCGHRWYTAQEPEYLIRPERVSWTGGKARKMQVQRQDERAA